jgi:hypothetical protein
MRDPSRQRQEQVIPRCVHRPDGCELLESDMYGVVDQKEDNIAKRCFTQLNMRVGDVDWVRHSIPRLAIV